MEKSEFESDYQPFYKGMNKLFMSIVQGSLKVEVLNILVLNNSSLQGSAHKNGPIVGSTPRSNLLL